MAYQLKKLLATNFVYDFIKLRNINANKISFIYLDFAMSLMVLNLSFCITCTFCKLKKNLKKLFLNVLN